MGARLDQDLFHLLQIEEYREALRHVLVETYFDPATQERLLRQSAFNYQVAAYSSDLLERARKQIREKPVELKEDPVRDQGFRRAIVRAYNHRCSLCGVRILTAEGHTAIAAAHIIPWRVSHDDDPRNGLALCHLCHWTFDEGLVTVGNNYQIRMSPQLAHSENVPGHLATIADRDLIGPSEESLWPFKESLQWHRQEVFRRR
ncbi:MAG: HNH endonuclease [Candidatus Promineifilaceae bacterium]|nr:HNH endonuclease [Candidatus Promineifilaceae bacterium]